MKLKRILAGVAAASVAVSALAVSAFAANGPIVDGIKLEGVTAVSDDNTFSFNLAAPGVLDGVDVADIYGASIALSEDTVTESASSGIGGAIALNGNVAGWAATDWGNDGAGKTITMTADGVITLQKDAALFTADEVSGKEQTWAQLCFQTYWGPEATVVSLSLLGKDGSALKTYPEVAEEDPDVGTTDFSHGGITTQEIPVEDPGSVFQNDDGDYQLDVVNQYNNVNLLGEAVADVDNAKAVGIRFKVSDFQAGDPTMEVSAITNANTADGENLYRWNDDSVNGVTISSGDYPVATITGNGEYIVWIVYDSSISYDKDFLASLVGTLDETAPAAIADDEAVLPYNIEVLSVGVQEADADVTPVEPDDPSEPTPENPGDEPTPEDPGDEPTTPGDSTEPDDNSSDDNSSDDNNGNTSVDDGGDNNPGTGVALAVVPAVLAAGALATATIVLKKRK